LKLTVMRWRKVPSVFRASPVGFIPPAETAGPVSGTVVGGTGLAGAVVGAGVSWTGRPVAAGVGGDGWPVAGATGVG